MPPLWPLCCFLGFLIALLHHHFVCTAVGHAHNPMWPFPFLTDTLIHLVDNSGPLLDSAASLHLCSSDTPRLESLFFPYLSLSSQIQNHPLWHVVLKKDFPQNHSKCPESKIYVLNHRVFFSLSFSIACFRALCTHMHPCTCIHTFSWQG